MSRTESRRPARPPRAVGWWFHEVAPLSPLANLVAVPWVGLVVVPPALAGAWAPEPLATVAVFGGDRAVGALAWVLPWLAVSPWVLGFGPVGAALAALVLVVPRRQVVLPALAVALLGVREARPELVVTFLDVGQGDAALVEWPDGRRWLVDGGPPSDAVLSWLRRRGVGFLDVVVASHGHLGGLVPVLEELAVGELWVPTFAGLGPLLEVADARGVEVIYRPAAALHPRAPFYADDDNDLSMVLSAPGPGAGCCSPATWRGSARPRSSPRPRRSSRWPTTAATPRTPRG